MKFSTLICLIAIVIAAPGCRNRCGNGCLSPWAQATIPPPPTYALQLPGMGSSTTGVASTGPTGQLGPNLTVSNLNQGGNANISLVNSTPGWSIPNATNQANVSSTLTPATFGTSDYQVSASSVYGTGGGTSRIVNHDYSSTPYNDRLDPSRLALSDASLVRPPVNLQTNLNPNDPRFANSNVPGAYQPGFGTNQRNFGFSGQTVVQGQFANPQTNFQNPSQLPSSNPATDPNRQAGWQNRNEINR